MLIRPGRVPARLIDRAVDGVGADEIPEINRLTDLAGGADKFLFIDGCDAAVRECRARRATVHFGLVDVDAFFVLAGGSSWGRARRAGASRQTVTGGLRRGIKISRIGYVVIDAGQGGTSAG